MRLLPIFTAIVLAASALPAAAAPFDGRLIQLFGSDEGFEEFFTDLQSAVADNDAQAVADMVYYPLQSNNTDITSPAQFVDDYDELITPRVAQAIADQDYSQLFVNQEGLMIGDGDVWFAPICRDEICQQFDIKIIAINP